MALNPCPKGENGPSQTGKRPRASDAWDGKICMVIAVGGAGGQGIITGDYTTPLLPRLELHLGGRIDGKTKKNGLGFGAAAILIMQVSYFSIANDPAYQWAGLIKVWFNIMDMFSSMLTHTNEMLAYGVLRQHGSWVRQLDSYGWRLSCSRHGKRNPFRKLIKSHFNQNMKENAWRAPAPPNPDTFFFFFSKSAALDLTFCWQQATIHKPNMVLKLVICTTQFFKLTKGTTRPYHADYSWKISVAFHWIGQNSGVSFTLNALLLCPVF